MQIPTTTPEPLTDDEFVGYLAAMLGEVPLGEPATISDDEGESLP